MLGLQRQENWSSTYHRLQAPLEKGSYGREVLTEPSLGLGCL